MTDQVQTTTVEGNPTDTAIQAIHRHSEMMTVTHAGTVKLDWKVIDAAAADADDEVSVIRALARALLAARDETWRPISDKDLS